MLQSFRELSDSSKKAMLKGGALAVCTTVNLVVTLDTLINEDDKVDALSNFLLHATIPVGGFLAYNYYKSYRYHRGVERGHAQHTESDEESQVVEGATSQIGSRLPSVHINLGD